MILKDFHLSRIENVDFDCTVGEFKGRVAEHINFLKDNIGKLTTFCPILPISLLLTFTRIHRNRLLWYDTERIDNAERKRITARICG